MGRAFEYRKARKLKRWGNMARTFTKIGKEISIAVKAGGPDPDSNPRLRVLMQNAKAANMPKENVERAIQESYFERCRRLQGSRLRRLWTFRYRYTYRNGNGQYDPYGGQCP